LIGVGRDDAWGHSILDRQLRLAHRVVNPVEVPVAVPDCLLSLPGRLALAGWGSDCMRGIGTHRVSLPVAVSGMDYDGA
jgi:hypothetical protein